MPTDGLNPTQLRARNVSNPTALRTMALTLFAFSGPSMRLVPMWLLAVVLALQGMTVGIFSALGPSHIHKAAQSILVLQDVRHWKPSPVRKSALSALLGHSHGSASAQRHHHAFDDLSVINLDVDSAANGSGVDEGLSAGALLASFWPLSSHFVTWQPLHGSNALAARPFWTSTSVVVMPHDRPPKSAV